MSDDEIELLTSPIERRAVSRLFVIGGPLGLAIAIIVSLWVSHLRISDSVIVQTEPQWIPGESLALRFYVDGDAGGAGTVALTSAVLLYSETTVDLA